MKQLKQENDLYLVNKLAKPGLLKTMAHIDALLFCFYPHCSMQGLIKLHMKTPNNLRITDHLTEATIDQFLPADLLRVLLANCCKGILAGDTGGALWKIRP